MVFLSQRKQVALELEATEGTAETIIAADLIHPAFDVEYTPTFEFADRNVVQDSFSRIASVPGERSAQITFSVELKGSGTAGTAPSQLAKPLQACAFGETIVASTSVTYAPVSESIKSATVEMREVDDDGTAKIFQLVGARGTVVFTAVKGQPVMATFTFTGRYIEPTEGSMLTTPAPTPNPIPFLNASVSFQAVGTLKVQNVEIDMANTVALRNDANQVSGNFSALITGRVPTGTLDPEMEENATFNPWKKLTDGDEGVLSYALTGSAGNITTVNAPKVQLTNVEQGDRDAITITPLSFVLNQSVDIGDDEISIAFT